MRYKRATALGFAALLAESPMQQHKAETTKGGLAPRDATQFKSRTCRLYRFCELEESLTSDNRGEEPAGEGAGDATGKGV
ncbi:hypothetical protein PoB_003266200 [Plakobranchus ocellatus]|uniref:Uncharacterized protein n=1 Tax=Plakobranchus ocellatus TaxID=259542 RepID=A0AAV4AFY1_9GAST|nr:hypothetical protein PoB_003266200 [Plakobranchus ocellatus]